MPPDEVTLTLQFREEGWNPGPVSWRSCMVEKPWPFRTWSTGEKGQSDFIRGVRLSWYVNCSLLFSMQNSPSPSLDQREEREREREVEQVQCCSWSHRVIYMASRRVWLCNRFPVNCSLYESRSLGPIDPARCHIFILDFPQQLVVWRSYHVMKFFCRETRKKMMNFPLSRQSGFKLRWYYCQVWIFLIHVLLARLKNTC